MRDGPKDFRRRRHRFAAPQSTGKCVRPGAVALSTFLTLDNHGPLSSAYLFALLDPPLKDRTGYLKRLRDYYHEDNAPHGGQYLEKPWQQTQTADFRQQTVVYANKLSAWRLLADAGLIEERPANQLHEKQNFWHQHMIACITASIELACRAQGLRFIPKREVLQGKNLSIEVPITFEGERYEGPLRPDSVFAIEYPDGIRTHFFLEADRETEGVNVNNLKARSYRRKLLQYRRLIGGGIYKDFLGTAEGALVLHVTTDAAHMRTIIASLMKITEGKGNTTNLFECAPNFGRFPVITPPTMMFGNECWIRAGHPPMNILE